MVATKLSLYNGALLLCEARRISGLTVNEEARYVLDSVWDSGAIDTCLEVGLWNHAMRSGEWTYDTAYTDPLNAGWYRFEKPDDWIRVAGVFTDQSFTVPDLSYHDEGNYIYSNYQTLYVRYVSNGASYGADYSLWPNSFERYVEHYLAFRIIGRITGGQTDKQWMEIQMKKQLASALAKDAQREPTKFPPETAWNGSRHSFRMGRGSRDYSGM
jgi:hypothetical protein